jgi:hypothetical protein
MLRDLGGRLHPLRRKVIAPSETRIRTLLHLIDTEVLDEIIGGCVTFWPQCEHVRPLNLLGRLSGRWSELSGCIDGGVLGFDYHVDLLIYDVDDVPYPGHLFFYRADLGAQQILEVRFQRRCGRQILLRLSVENICEVVVAPVEHRRYRHQRGLGAPVGRLPYMADSRWRQSSFLREMRG